MNHPTPLRDALKRPLPPEVVDGLRALFGDRLSLAQAVRDHHGRDESPFPMTPPDAVVFAHTTDEVSGAVAACARHRVPIIPYGVGSSLEGHLLAIHGGVSIDLSQMNQVLKIDADDLTAAGVEHDRAGTGFLCTAHPLGDRQVTG